MSSAEQVIFDIAKAIVSPYQHGSLANQKVVRYKGKILRLEFVRQVDDHNVLPGEQAFHWSAPDTFGTAGPGMWVANGTTSHVNGTFGAKSYPVFKKMIFETDAFYSDTKAAATLASEIIVESASSRLNAAGTYVSGVTGRTISPGELTDDKAIANTNVVSTVCLEGAYESLDMSENTRQLSTRVISPVIPEVMQAVGGYIPGRMTSQVYTTTKSTSEGGAPELYISSDAQVQMTDMIAGGGSLAIKPILTGCKRFIIDGRRSSTAEAASTFTVCVVHMSGSRAEYSALETFDSGLLAEPIQAIYVAISVASVGSRFVVSQETDEGNEYTQRAHIGVINPVSVEQNLTYHRCAVIARVLSPIKERAYISRYEDAIPCVDDVMSTVYAFSHQYPPVRLCSKHERMMSMEDGDVLDASLMVDDLDDVATTYGAAGPMSLVTGKLRRLKRKGVHKKWFHELRPVLSEVIEYISAKHPQLAEELNSTAQLGNKMRRLAKAAKTDLLNDPEVGAAGISAGFGFSGILGDMLKWGVGQAVHQIEDHATGAIDNFGL